MPSYTYILRSNLFKVKLENVHTLKDLLEMYTEEDKLKIIEGKTNNKFKEIRFIITGRLDEFDYENFKDYEPEPGTLSCELQELVSDDDAIILQESGTVNDDESNLVSYCYIITNSKIIKIDLLTEAEKMADTLKKKNIGS